jgi:hypothetical protein
MRRGGGLQLIYFNTLLRSWDARRYDGGLPLATKGVTELTHRLIACSPCGGARCRGTEQQRKVDRVISLLDRPAHALPTRRLACRLASVRVFALCLTRAWQTRGSTEVTCWWGVLVVWQLPPPPPFPPPLSTPPSTTLSHFDHRPNPLSHSSPTPLITPPLRQSFPIAYSPSPSRHLLFAIP